MSALLGSGCTALCDGPGCEDDWSAARLAVHLGGASGELGVVTQAAAVIDVADDLGPELTAVGLGDDLVLGHPAAGYAVRVPPPWEEVDYDRAWGEADSGYGASMAVLPVWDEAGAALVAGAPDRDLARGAVFLETGASGTAGSTLRIDGEAVGDRLGEVVAVCPDLTGDGLPDLLLAAPWARAGGAPELAGVVYLVRSEDVVGRSGYVAIGAVGTPWWGTSAGDAAGRALACAADLDGDGVADPVVGVPLYGADDRGAVVVLSGAHLPEAGTLTGRVLLEGEEPGAAFGTAVAVLEGPDVQLAVGAPGAATGRGATVVYSAPLRDDVVPDWHTRFVPADDRSETDHVGRALLAADLDGDGADDLVVGAPDYREGNAWDAGRAWVLLAASSGGWERRTPLTSDAAQEVLVAEAPFQRVGRHMSAADLDGDGREDLILPLRRAP